jgi:hypothetical protein
VWAENPIDLSNRAVAARTEASSSTIEIAGAFATRPHFLGVPKHRARSRRLRHNLWRAFRVENYT